MKNYPRLYVVPKLEPLPKSRRAMRQWEAWKRWTQAHDIGVGADIALSLIVLGLLLAALVRRLL